MVKVKDFPIFEAGEYPQGTFTEQDVAQIVETYDPDTLTAGAVLGHTLDYDTKVPNLGVIHGLKKIGKQLWTNGVELAESLVAAIKDKSVKYPSIELYKPEDPTNPTKGKYYLGNIGFLGAKNPAVKGLPMLATALGFTEKRANLMSIETKLEFAEVEEITKAANDDTYDRIKLEFKQCLDKCWEYMKSDESNESKRSKCSLACNDCHYAVERIVNEHFQYVEKTESVIGKMVSAMTDMVERMMFSRGGLVSEPVLTRSKQPHIHTTEVDMTQQEFTEAEAKLNTQKAELDAQKAALATQQAAIDVKAAEFAEADKVRKAAEAKTAGEHVDAQVLAFKEELKTAGYPVKKMEEQGVFGLAKTLLTSNELQFGEEKKKPFDILKGLVQSFKPITTGTEFKEETVKSLNDTAKAIGMPAGASFSMEGLAKVQFAEQYLAKHNAEIPGGDAKEKLAFVMTKLMLGEIKYDPKTLN